MKNKSNKQPVTSFRSFLSKRNEEPSNSKTKRVAILIAITFLLISSLAVAVSVKRFLFKGSFRPEDDNEDSNYWRSERFLQEEDQIQYSNVKDRSFLMSYPKNGPVIAMLVAATEKDVEGCCIALKSLAFLGGDDPDHPAPVLIFNEGDLTVEQRTSITSCTERPIAFPLVDFTEFPAGFDKEVISEKFVVEGRSEWGYYQMIRFWVTGIWKHSALDPYETVMRLDTDSCFKETNDILPVFQYNDLVYHSQFIGIESDKQYVVGLIDFAEEFFQKIGRIPASPMFWDFVKLSWDVHNSLPTFMPHFELTRKSFMKHPDVTAWHEALTEQDPFGMFRYRWNVGIERFLTAVMFASNDRIMTSQPKGYFHGDKCPKSIQEIEELTKSIKEVSPEKEESVEKEE